MQLQLVDSKTCTYSENKKGEVEDNVAFNAMPNPFLPNKICLNQERKVWNRIRWSNQKWQKAQVGYFSRRKGAGIPISWKTALLFAPPPPPPPPHLLSHTQRHTKTTRKIVLFLSCRKKPLKKKALQSVLVSQADVFPQFDSNVNLKMYFPYWLFHVEQSKCKVIIIGFHWTFAQKCIVKNKTARDRL